MKLLALIFTLFIVAGTYLGYQRYQSLLSSPLNPEITKTFVLVVQPKMTVTQIFNQLESEALLPERRWTLFAAKVQKLGAKVKAGEYEVRSNMSLVSLFTLLQSGKTIGRTLTIPEGYNIFELAKLFENEKLMSQQEFISYVTNPQNIQDLLNEPLSSLEGYLFPESYQVTKQTTGTDLIHRMVKTSLKRYQEFEPMQKSLGWSRTQVLTLASIIEKETGAPWERPLISSVFHNRLKKRMKLQTDPTVLYAKALDMGNFEIRIGRQDLRRPHPYNTYHIYGLPPGPIANPGTEAIRAVFQPDVQSRFLYFVSRNDGTHIFSETYQQHNKAVTEYQKNPKAREGRSWRELSDKIKKPTN